MRAAVIGGNTYNGYKYELWNILEYGCRIQNINLHWLTTEGRDQFNMLKIAVDQAQGRVAKAAAKWNGLRRLLDHCHDNPLLQVDNVTPESYMDYLQSQREADGSFLRSGNYKSKTSALFHLFRCHPNLEGYPEGFEEKLKTLKIGFLRTVVTSRADAGNADDDGK